MATRLATNEQSSRVSTRALAVGTAGNGKASRVADRYLAVRGDLDRKLDEYRRVLAETGERRQRAVRTLRRAGYLRD